MSWTPNPIHTKKSGDDCSIVFQDPSNMFMMIKRVQEMPSCNWWLDKKIEKSTKILRGPIVYNIVGIRGFTLITLSLTLLTCFEHEVAWV